MRDFIHSLCLFVGLLVFVIGCGSQEPPKLKSEINLLAEDQDQIKACSKLDMYKNPLSKKSTLTLFECFKWQKNYPHLYQAIEGISEASWNHLNAPLESFIFDNDKNKDLFLQFLVSLNNEDRIKNLQSALKVLLEQDIPFSKLSSIFQKYSQDKSLQDPGHQLMDYAYKHKDLASLLIDLGMMAFRPIHENSKNDFGKYFSEFSSKYPGYDEYRLAATQALINYLKNDIDTYDLQTALRSLTYRDPSSPWIKEWIHHPQNSAQDFIDLMRVPINTYPHLVSDIEDLNYFKAQNPVCYAPGSDQTNGMALDFSAETHQLMGSIVGSEPQDLYDLLIETYSKVSLVGESCDFGDDAKLEPIITTSLPRFVGALADLTRTPMGFLFMKLSTESTYIKEDKKSSEVFLRLAGSDFLKNTLESNKLVEADKDFDSFLTSLYEYIRDLPAQLVLKAVPVLKTLIEDQGLLKSLPAIWDEFSHEERLALLKVVDKNLSQEGQGFTLLETLHLLNKALPELQPYMIEKLIGDSDKQTKSLASLSELVAMLDSSEVRKEVVAIVNSGMLERMIALLKNGVKAIELKEEEFTKSVPAIYSKIERLKVEGHLECLKSYHDQLLNKLKVWEIPSKCRELNKLPFLTKAMDWIDLIEQTYEETFPGDSLIGEGKIISPAAAHMSMTHLIVLNDVLDSSNEFSQVKDILIEIRDQLEKNNLLPLLEKSLDLIGKHSLDEPFFYEAVKAMGTVDEKVLKSILAEGKDLLLDYDQHPFSPQEDRSINKCREDFTTDYGYEYCFNREYLETHLFNILDLVKKKPKDQDVQPLLETMLEAFYPGVGVEIPYKPEGKTKKKYEERKRMKWITAEEFLYFLYDLGDSKNSFEMKYFDGKKSSRKVSVTPLQAQEIMLRDPSFINNFYGSFFMNEIAAGKYYDKKLRSLRFNLGLLNTFGFIFRMSDSIPPESSYLVKNAKNAFGSLKAIAKDYQRPDGSTHNYSDLIQAFSTVLVKSSDHDVQHFSPLAADDQLGLSHNAMFFAELAKLSGMSHMLRYFKFRIGDDFFKITQNPDFQLVSNKLPTLFSLDKMKTALRKLMERHYKGRGDEITFIVKDLLNRIDSMSSGDLREVEALAWKGSVLLARSDFKSGELDPLLDNISAIVGIYPEIVKYLPNQNALIEILLDTKEMVDFLYDNKKRQPLVNSFLRLFLHMGSQPKLTSSLVNMVKSKPDFWVPELYNLYQEVKNITDGVDYVKLNRLVNFMSEMASHADFSLSALLIPSDDEVELKNRVEQLRRFIYFLLEKKEEKTYLRIGLETLLEYTEDIGNLIDKLSNIISFKRVETP